MSILLLAFLLLYGCKKNDNNPCDGKTLPVAEFEVKEVVGDTAFTADTVFRNNLVRFEALTRYESVTWKIGNDSRVFTTPDFTLSFYRELGKYSVEFRGTNPPSSCFPNDSGIYKGTKQFVVVEQIEKPILTISPLIGRYHGFSSDNPTDTFTVTIKYFDSTKYNILYTGSQNFYYLNNLPNGFTDFTSDRAMRYPELQHGIKMQMGYKSFAYDYASCFTAGKGWLSNDTLYVLYGNSVCGRKKFIGTRY